MLLLLIIASCHFASYFWSKFNHSFVFPSFPVVSSIFHFASRRRKNIIIFVFYFYFLFCLQLYWEWSKLNFDFSFYLLTSFLTSHTDGLSWKWKQSRQSRKSNQYSTDKLRCSMSTNSSTLQLCHRRHIFILLLFELLENSVNIAFNFKLLPKRTIPLLIFLFGILKRFFSFSLYIDIYIYIR